MRRKLTRRGTSSRQQRVASAYEEEEEGYVSGEYDDGPFELVKIRVKVCWTCVPRYQLSLTNITSSSTTAMKSVVWR